MIFKRGAAFRLSASCQCSPQHHASVLPTRWTFQHIATTFFLCCCNMVLSGKVSSKSIYLLYTPKTRDENPEHIQENWVLCLDCTGLGLRRSGFQLQHCHWIIVWPWASLNYGRLERQGTVASSFPPIFDTHFILMEDSQPVLAINSLLLSPPPHNLWLSPLQELLQDLVPECVQCSLSSSMEGVMEARRMHAVFQSQTQHLGPNRALKREAKGIFEAHC